jgi:hypothetical protein
MVEAPNIIKCSPPGSLQYPCFPESDSDSPALPPLLCLKWTVALLMLGELLEKQQLMEHFCIMNQIPKISFLGTKRDARTTNMEESALLVPSTKQNGQYRISIHLFLTLSSYCKGIAPSSGSSSSCTTAV